MAQLAGGWSQKPVDDEQVQVMAAFAVPEVQGDINHTAFFQLASIDAVEAQVRPAGSRGGGAGVVMVYIWGINRTV